MSHSHLQRTILRLYKDLLIQAKHLVDPKSQAFAEFKIRSRFRDNMLDRGAARIQQNLNSGRKALRMLKRANAGEVQSFDKVIQLTYGRRGSMKHELLKEYFKEPIGAWDPPFYPYEADQYTVHPDLRDTPQDEDPEISLRASEEGNTENATTDRTMEVEHQDVDPSLRNDPREENLEPFDDASDDTGTTSGTTDQTNEVQEEHVQPSLPSRRPPRIPLPIQALMNKDPNVDKFVLRNPPIFKPMPQKRLINQFYKHYTMAKRQLRAPLPDHLIEHLRFMAYEYRDDSLEIDFRRKLNEEFNTRPAGRQRPFSRQLHNLTSRFVRRRYQNLLKEYIPRIEKTEDGEWRVNYTDVTPDTNYPLLLPEHKMGFTFSCGTKVGRVNDDGVFAEGTPRGVFYQN